MVDDSFLKELKESSMEYGKLNLKALRETYYLSIKAGLSEPLCLECHEPFEFKPKQQSVQKLFCSEQHRKDFYSENRPSITLKKICPHCGVSFEVYDKGTGFRAGPKKYCRLQCRDEAHHKRKLIARMKQFKNFSDLRKRVERNMKTFHAGKGVACLECGELFVGSKNKKFCSDSPCGQKYRNRKKRNERE